MIDQQHLLLHHHNNNHLPQHCHQWIPPLGNSLLHNKKDMRKSATTTTKESNSPYIVAEFIPPRMDSTESNLVENEENSKEREEAAEKQRKMMETVEDSPTSSAFSSPQPTTTATKNNNNIYTIPTSLSSHLEEDDEEEKNKNNLIDILSFTPAPLFNNKQFENVLSESTTTALSSGGSSCADFDDPKDKKYFCQRCLNHKEEHPRKGHKPFCRYRDCQCVECQMVEKRRRLNNALNTRKPGEGKLKGLMGTLNLGPKARNPMCARCTAHGKESALRGHKKAVCPFRICECEKCGLVEERRRLMAAQIKLRRRQKKAREGGSDSIDDDNGEFCEILNNYNSESPLIVGKEINNKIILKQQKKPRQQYKPRKQWTTNLNEKRTENQNFGSSTSQQIFQRQQNSSLNSSLNLFSNSPRQQQQNQQFIRNIPPPPQPTNNLISAYLASQASQNNQQNNQQSTPQQFTFIASQPVPLQQLAPLQIATLVNNSTQQKQQHNLLLNSINSTNLPILPQTLPSSSSPQNSIFELLSSLPTSLLAQLSPQQLQNALQTFNFMRLSTSLNADNSNSMETEEENDDRKRATASEGIQQLSERTPVLFSTPPLTQTLNAINTPTTSNLINPLIFNNQPSQELTSSSTTSNTSSSFYINSLLSLFNQVQQ